MFGNCTHKLCYICAELYGNYLFPAKVIFKSGEENLNCFLYDWQFRAIIYRESVKEGIIKDLGTAKLTPVL
jgi:hypothetical protein